MNRNLKAALLTAGVLGGYGACIFGLVMLLSWSPETLLVILVVLCFALMFQLVREAI